MGGSHIFQNIAFIVLRFIAYTIVCYMLVAITNSWGLVTRWGAGLLLIPLLAALPNSFNRNLGTILKSCFDTESRNLEIYWQKPLSGITPDEIAEYRRAIFLRDLPDSSLHKTLRSPAFRNQIRTDQSGK